MPNPTPFELVLEAGLDGLEALQVSGVARDQWHEPASAEALAVLTPLVKAGRARARRDRRRSSATRRGVPATIVACRVSQSPHGASAPRTAPRDREDYRLRVASARATRMAAGEEQLVRQSGTGSPSAPVNVTAPWPNRDRDEMADQWATLAGRLLDALAGSPASEDLLSLNAATSDLDRRSLGSLHDVWCAVEGAVYEFRADEPDPRRTRAALTEALELLYRHLVDELFELELARGQRDADAAGFAQALLDVLTGAVDLLSGPAGSTAAGASQTPPCLRAPPCDVAAGVPLAQLVLALIAMPGAPQAPSSQATQLRVPRRALAA